MRSHKLLIIGAGPVGLGTADALKRNRIAYDQVDAYEGVGGLWRHGTYSTVHIISSKRSTAYADYPMPADYPDFPSRAQMLAYLESYARDRGLTEAIEFGRRVVKVTPRADDSWIVTLDGGETRHYKGVVICNGHHWDPIMPELPGTFSGRLIHSGQYTGPADVTGKRVLVIGGGNSGCDIASEAARVGAGCDWSLRSGYWFLPKSAFGRPLTDLPIWGLPVILQRPILRALIRITIGDYRKYGLKRPHHKLFDHHPTFGTEALNYLKTGRITARPGIEAIDGHTVRFSDGTTGNYDLIVAATGFHNSFPFLDPGLIEIKNEVVQARGGAFFDHLKNFYVVGAFQPRNGFGGVLTPVAEFYAHLIKLQDEIDAPIGVVLKWLGETMPTTQAVNPAVARRYAKFSVRAMPLLRAYARLVSRFHRRAPLPQLAANVVELPVGAPERDRSAA